MALFLVDMAPINNELYKPELIKEKLAKGLVRSPQILAGSHFLDTSAKDSPEYQDPNYFPFYFYLGQQLQSEQVFQIGSRLGLVGACFLQGCRTVENWFSLDISETSVAGVVKGNLQRHCGGAVRSECTDRLVGHAGADVVVEVIDALAEKHSGWSWTVDTAFVSDKFDSETYKAALGIAWGCLKSGGILIADYISSDELQPIFASFCRVKNRESLIFETRYGVGITQR